jgi:tetratricopeptide (TPR) repeat protein
MTVQQHGPVPTVSWPVRTGPVPPVAPYFSARPETGFGAGAGLAPDQQRPLIRGDEAGSYILTGPAGAGKTQLATAYASTLWQSGDIELLVWITASSRSAIINGYAQAFRQTSVAPGGPPGPGPAGTSSQVPGADMTAAPGPAGGYGGGQDQEEMARQFLRWLAVSTRSWVVVLDDLADAADLADDLWPRGAMGRTVLTTRLLPASISPPSRHAKLVQVGPYSRREALAYLTARLFEDTAQRNGALDLAEVLDRLPIALAHAAALIADCRIDGRDYQTQYDERRRAMGLGSHSTPTSIVAVTWSLALERSDQVLPSALARPVLAMLALLDANGIPAGVLTSKAAREYVGSYSADRAPATDEQVRGVLTGLAQVGLLTIDPTSAARTVYLHALVQQSVQQVLPVAVRDQAAVATANALAQAWPDRNPDPHLDQALRDCLTALTQAAGDALWTPDGHPVLLRAGQSLDAARLKGPALAYWQALTEQSVRVQGEDNPQTLQYMQYLAGAYEAADQLDMAMDMLVRSLAHLEEALGPGHVETLTAHSQLGKLCLSAGWLDEALPHFERALAGREWVLGPDHPDTLASRSDLAGGYRAVGRLDDAITVYRRTLTDQELILGEDHPTTVATRGSLAAALQAAGRVKDAVQLYTQTLADRERALGPDHPDTITARASLAYAYRSAGRIKEALPLYVRTVADRERVQGPDHPDTITARAVLAGAYFAARKIREALPLYERTVADRERVQGPDHPDTITARGNLASAYHSAGKLVVATQLYERTLADYERVLGPHHENTLTSRVNLAMAYYAAHRMTDAVSLLRHTLSDCERALPPGHPLTQSVRESLEAATRG